MNFRSGIVSLLVVMAVGLLAGCGQTKEANTNTANTAKSERVIRIGYQTGSANVILARSKGWFEEEFAKDGVKIKYDLFLAGAPMNEAMAGNRIDITSVGNLPALAAKAAGIEAKIVGRASSDKFYYALLTKADSTANSVQDLKGKKIAVQVGSGAHLFLFLLLHQNGLKPADVNIVSMSAPDQQLALDTGNVDAIATWQPWIATIENSKIGKILVNSEHVVQSVGVYLARNEFADKNPDLVERFLKVHQRTAEYIKAHPQEAVELISKETKIPVAALSKAYQTINWDLKITDENIKTLKDSKDFLIQTNVLKKDFDVNDLIDRRHLEKIGVK
jgi:sulfonate transport system substrate-binding protein